jgi:hypothetical protein
VGAGAASLAGVYRNLTGDASSPFPSFKGALDRAYPGTTEITGPNPDNPWPLEPLARSQSTISAISRFQNHMDLFVVDRDGKIYTTFWDQGIPAPGWYGHWYLV